MSAFFATLRAWFSAMFATPKRAAGTASTAAVLAATALFVGPWEGERTEAYLDRIASPPVWTVCYGETRGVKPGDRYTPKQCRDVLITALADYHAPLAKCIPMLPDQPLDVQVALTSWAYNVGPSAACGSTLAKLAKAGDWRGACTHMTGGLVAGAVTLILALLGVIVSVSWPAPSQF